MFHLRSREGEGGCEGVRSEANVRCHRHDVRGVLRARGEGDAGRARVDVAVNLLKNSMDVAFDDGAEPSAVTVAVEAAVDKPGYGAAARVPAGASGGRQGAGSRAAQARPVADARPPRPSMFACASSCRPSFTILFLPVDGYVRWPLARSSSWGDRGACFCSLFTAGSCCCCPSCSSAWLRVASDAVPTALAWTHFIALGSAATR